MLDYIFLVVVVSIPIVAIVLYGIKILSIEGNYFGNQDYENGTEEDVKIHPEYRDVFESVLKEKEEKEMRLNSIKLLNKEIEEVDRINKEIEGFLNKV